MTAVSRRVPATLTGVESRVRRLGRAFVIHARRTGRPAADAALDQKPAIWWSSNDSWTSRSQRGTRSIGVESARCTPVAPLLVEN